VPAHLNPVCPEQKGAEFGDLLCEPCKNSLRQANMLVKPREPEQQQQQQQQPPGCSTSVAALAVQVWRVMK